MPPIGPESDPLPPMASGTSWETKLVMRIAADSQAVSLSSSTSARLFGLPLTDCS